MNLLLPLLAAYALSDLLLRHRGRLGSGIRSAGVRRSDSWSIDGVYVGLVYLAVVVILGAGRPVFWVAALAGTVAHIAIAAIAGPVDPASKVDAAAASAFQKRGLASELVYQAGGLALVLVVAIVIPATAGGDPFEAVQIDSRGRMLRSSAWPVYGTMAARFLGAWALVYGLGQDLVRLTLEGCRAIPARVESDDRDAPLLDAEPRLGRVIGVLERLLIVTLVLQSAWVGIGLIVAAKSIARFKELEEQRFSEYYLVGTLASLMVAVVVGLVMSVPVVG